MIRLSSVLILFFLAQLCRAQLKYDRIWIFGDSAGIDFNDLQNPVPIKSSCSLCHENNASICNADGELQFYMNCDSLFWSASGYSVYDFTHHLMCNGDSIITGNSTTQGSLIIPSESIEGKYFLITVQTVNDVPGPSALRYSVIDMNLNNGQGCVTEKNILLLDTLVTEKLQAVRHANGKDWWILCHGINSHIFYRYLLSNDEFIGPMSQEIGDGNYIVGRGQMKFSQDGSMLLTAPDNNGLLELYYFDRCTGELAALSLFAGELYGCEFAAEGRYLYTAGYTNIYRYDLTANNIGGSQEIVFVKPQPNDSIPDPELEVLGQMQLAPDGKIYCAVVRNGAFFYPWEYVYYLTVINSPDASNCNVEYIGISLLGSSMSGLPNMPNYNLGAILPPIVNAGEDLVSCGGQPVQLHAAACANCSYSWEPAEFLSNANSSNPFATVAATTTFTLTVTDTAQVASCNKTSTDTVAVFVTDNTPAIQTLYCIPCGDEFFSISLPLSSGGVRLEVINVNGQRVFQTENYQNDLALKNLASGMYFFKINLPDCYEVEGKFVVVR